MTCENDMVLLYSKKYQNGKKSNEDSIECACKEESLRRWNNPVSKMEDKKTLAFQEPEVNNEAKSSDPKMV
jgi:hypothetical protein